MKNPYPKGTVMETLWDNHQLLKTSRCLFRKVFGTDISNFWDNYTGFNLAAFDRQFLKSPDTESIFEAVLEQYGEAGVTLIEKLIHYNE